MVVSAEKYDQLKLERLRSILEDAHAAGSPEFYEIYVDGWKVIKRTNDVGRFDKYEDHVDENTEKIKIILYGDSPASRKGREHVFFMKEAALVPIAKPVDGTDVDERIARERKQWEAEQTKRELEDTKNQLTEAEEYIDQLQDELKSLREQGHSTPNNGLIQAGSLMLENVIRRNPELIAKIPGGEMLAGYIIEDNKTKQLSKPTQPDTEVSFSKTGGNGFTEEEKRYKSIIEEMEAHFNVEQLNKVMWIIQTLSQQPSSIDPVAELLKQ